LYRYGHTFRWVKGDRYVAVMADTCVDGRRVIVIDDAFAGHTVHESPQPLVDAIAVAADDWPDDVVLRRLADDWASRRGLLRRCRCRVQP
jgi:hypothetical protein